MKFYKGEIIKTDDGSMSLKHCLLNDTYHSTSGALQESLHIYINSGLAALEEGSVRVFEMGFGTGLNMLLTIDYALKNNILIDYHTVELYPLDLETIKDMGFDKFCSSEVYDIYLAAHGAEWNTEGRVVLHENFAITKYQVDITRFEGFPKDINLVYYDAFAPDTQPELWSETIFSRLYQNMVFGSILMTYSSKGDVKRALRGSGFFVKRLSGPGNKRHIVKATKEGDHN